MRLAFACCSVSMALAMSGCSAPARAPLNFGNGVGSQYGNYVAQADGEMQGPAGERCVVFNWDRPLTNGLAVRLRSASCESKQHPNWMDTREIARTVIPLSESTVRDELNTARP